MTYIVSYVINGISFATKELSQREKEDYVHVLESSGIKFDVLERNSEKQYRMCRVVFELKDVEPALKDPAYKWSYTFGDPKGFSKDHKVIKVLCSTGEEKPVFVVQSWTDGEENIKKLRQQYIAEGKLKSGHFSLVTGVIG